jgi:hypothetical protein
MARVRAAQELQRWYSNKITLMADTFPIYAADGWSVWIDGSGSHGDDLTHLTIAHAVTLPGSIFVCRPRIEITTSIDPHQPRRHHDVTITIAAREIDPACIRSSARTYSETQQVMLCAGSVPVPAIV